MTRSRLPLVAGCDIGLRQLINLSHEIQAFQPALEEQLGLRLVLGRGPVEMLVVERLEQPSPD